MVPDDIETSLDADESEGQSTQPLAEVLQLRLDDNNTVIGSTRSNVEQIGMITVTPEIYADASGRMGRVKYENGVLVSYEPSPQPTPIVVPKLELYRRMTDEEYEQMGVGVASQSKRIQDIFSRVENFREDDSLWPLLVSMGHQLFGEDRTKELLAPL